MTTRERRVDVATHAALRLYGDELDPAEVTRALELPPDHGHRKGDPRIGRTKRGRVIQHSAYGSGLWSMSSEPWVSSPRLHVHIEWILREIEPKARVLARFLERGVSADVFCYSLGRSPSPPAVPRSLRTRLRALGLKLEIDHYEERDADRDSD